MDKIVNALSALKSAVQSGESLDDTLLDMYTDALRDVAFLRKDADRLWWLANKMQESPVRAWEMIGLNGVDLPTAIDNGMSADAA